MDNATAHGADPDLAVAAGVHEDEDEGDDGDEHGEEVQPAVELRQTETFL